MSVCSASDIGITLTHKTIHILARYPTFSSHGTAKSGIASESVLFCVLRQRRYKVGGSGARTGLVTIAIANHPISYS